jgi:hypothetical protein|nr:MAG: winged helix DNA-binding domain-containing protein [Pseudomonadota bacterium]
MDIVPARLSNHRLLGRTLSRPEQVVEWLGAVQAQDFAAAKWAVALRMKSARDTDIERAFDAGRILRTHVLRPTWHFVLPDDIRWMLELTAPRIRPILAYGDRRNGIDRALISRAERIVERALEGGKHLTREELAAELAKHGIEARGQKLAHIVAHAELDALICSGPLRGRQFTYALLEERVPKVRRLTRDESLATLALRYFRSHGPATLHDFAKWSGLSLKEAREAVALDGSVREAQRDSGMYRHVRSTSSGAVPSPHARLLSIYDEYVIAYRDWDVLCGERGLKQRLFAQGNAIPNVLLIDGRIAGTWRRSLTEKEARLTITPLRKLTPEEKTAVDQEVERYSEFLGRPVSAQLTAAARGSGARKRKIRLHVDMLKRGETIHPQRRK